MLIRLSVIKGEMSLIRIVFVCTDANEIDPVFRVWSSLTEDEPIYLSLFLQLC